MPTWSTTDIATLRAAIASGTLKVEYSGPPQRAVTYQSTQSMIEALSMMLRENAAEAGSTTFRKAATSKGV